MDILEQQDSFINKLLLVFREKLSGYFEISTPERQTVYVWIYQGKITTVISNQCSLKFLLMKHNFLSKKIIDIIAQNSYKSTISSNPRPLGYELEKIHGISSSKINFLFEEQIKFLKSIINFKLSCKFELVEQKSHFPLDEMTGVNQAIDNFLLDILRNNLNWQEGQNNYPYEGLCLKENYPDKFSIKQSKLSELEKQIMSYADEKSALSDIAQQLKIPLKDVQRVAFILNFLGFVDYALSPQERARLSKNLFRGGDFTAEATFLNKLDKTENRLLVPPLILLATFICLFFGIFQSVELKILDLFFIEHQEEKDTRITLVTIDDEDMEKIGKYPLPDGSVADALANIRQHNPRVIGLDLYRNLSIEPGTEKLSEIFRTTPNLIGVKKVSGRPISPNPILAEGDQISASDAILDPDGFVRRVLFSLEKEGQVIEGLGTTLALIYLSPETINFSVEENTFNIGQGKVTPLSKFTGGYWKEDLAGYQMLINYRGGIESFNEITLTQILSNQFDPSMIEDKVVILGSVSDADKDLFLTPESKTKLGVKSTPGPVIHANHTSQLISAALDGRPLLKPKSRIEEVIFIFILTVIAIAISFSISQIKVRYENFFPSWLLYVIIPSIATGGILILNYSLFLQGWWLPSIPTILSASCSAIALSNFLDRKAKTSMFFDKETSLPNRYYLEVFLDTLQEEFSVEELPLLTIEINNFYKYSNTYSDKIISATLKNISKVICDIVRDRDFVSRYNKTFFCVVLVKGNLTAISRVSKEIETQVYDLAIPFEGEPENILTVSCVSKFLDDV